MNRANEMIIRILKLLILAVFYIAGIAYAQQVQCDRDSWPLITATMTCTSDYSGTCKYDTQNVSYSAMAYTFSTTGTTSHIQELAANCGQDYIYYVKCSDSDPGYTVTFSVDKDPPPRRTYHVYSVLPVALNCVDYTTFPAPVDEDGDMTIAANLINVDTMRRDAVSYVRYDAGAGFFHDFTHYGYFDWTAYSGASANVGVWAVTEGERSSRYAGSIAGDGIFVYLYVDPANTATYLGISDYKTAAGDAITFGAAVPGKRWFKVARSGASITLTAYSDAYETPVGSVTIATTDATSYRYLYGCVSAGYADAYSASTITADKGCLDIGAELP